MQKDFMGTLLPYKSRRFFDYKKLYF